ncbi:MAG: class I SAM-dependent methyltransferase [Candidatus Nanopelagicaceae bacterium]|nr:class I SAM-dependent methyltransferase [Candidatus Nanopelagicaceae bacterium]
MKVLIAALAGGPPKFAALAESIRDTWGRCGPCDVVLYRGCRPEDPSIPIDSIQIRDTIVGIHDDRLVHMYYQCVDMFSQALKYDFDYLFRCCCGSYINQFELLKFIEDKPRTGFYCGIIGTRGSDVYASGSGFFLSRDLVELFVKCRNEALTLPALYEEDILIGRFLRQKGIVVSSGAKRIDVADPNQEPVPNQYHYHLLQHVHDRPDIIRNLHRKHKYPAAVEFKPCEFLLSVADVRAATRFLMEHDILQHETAQKNWDLAHVVPHLNGDVVDLGCVGSFILPNLIHRSIKGRKVGVDFRDAAYVAPGIEHIKANLEATGLPDKSFDHVTCLSVIEHNVDFIKFAKESARILRPKGQLYVTFDFWDPDLGVRQTCGQPWSILCRKDVERLISICVSEGLKLLNPVDWRFRDKTVCYDGQHYTFGVLTFVR